jgi:hypothetical protein
MVIAVINKLEIHQIDVRISSLKGDLDKDIYIEQLEGFVINGQENKFGNSKIFIWFERSS